MYLEIKIIFLELLAGLNGYTDYTSKVQVTFVVIFYIIFIDWLISLGLFSYETLGKFLEVP